MKIYDATRLVSPRLEFLVHRLLELKRSYKNSRSWDPCKDVDDREYCERLFYDRLPDPFQIVIKQGVIRWEMFYDETLEFCTFRCALYLNNRRRSFALLEKLLKGDL